jgi:hypothetical protein
MGRQSVELVAVLFAPVDVVVSLLEVRLQAVTVTFLASRYPPGITLKEVVAWLPELLPVARLPIIPDT